jgi:GT2 family glycosyltransferase
LIIFSDGAKNNSDSQKVQAIRDYIKTIKGFDRVEIVLRDRNFGLANSVISGVNEIFKQNDRVIVMEDDIVTSPTFLTFMNKALAFYQDNKSIYSVSGYPYPIKIPNEHKKDVFISYRASS